MEVLKYVEDNFWTWLLMLVIVWWVIGDGVRNAFYAVLSALTGRRSSRRLSRKEEKQLRKQVESLRQETEDTRRANMVAADILRDVLAADRVFPQMPHETMIRAEAFVDKYLIRPDLPPGQGQGSKPGKPETGAG